MYGKNKKDGMSDVEKEAKMNVVKNLRDEMAGKMSGRLSGLKKVTVASDSENGLKSGLEKAQEIVDKMPGSEEDMSEEEGMEDEHKMPMSKEEFMEMSPEAQQKHIDYLMECMKEKSE